VGEAHRILHRHGSKEAINFLNAQPPAYLSSAEFRALLERVQKRQVAEEIDRQLANDTNPDGHLRILANAIQKNKGNEELEKRLAVANERKRIVSSIVEHARAFEEERRYTEAVGEWDRMRKVYPSHPQLVSEIARLSRLDQQQRALSHKLGSVSSVDLPMSDSFRDQFDATRLMNQEDFERATVLETIQAPTRGARKGKIVGIGIVVAIVVLALILGIASLIRSSLVSVRIETNPPQSEIFVGNLTCESPCDLKIKPGSYLLQARREGYQPLSQQISIDQRTNIPLRIILNKIEASSAPPIASMGTLTISTNVEGADVFVDGSLQGTTGRDHKVSLTVMAGEHEVRVEKPGYPELSSRQVDITNDQRSSINFVFEPSAIVKSKPQIPQNSYVLITSLPGAQVAVDQRVVGRVPAKGTLVVQVSPNEHEVQVTAEGHEPFTTRTAIGTGEKVKIIADLKSRAVAISAPPSPPPFPPSAPVPSVTLTGSPATIELDQSTTLSWKATNATEVAIDGIGSVPASGSRQVTPSESTTYHVTAKGTGGTATASFQVTVLPLAAKKSAPVKSVDTAIDTDHKAIMATLSQYRDAYNSRDRVQLRHVWPTMTDRQFRDIQNAFKDANSISLTLRPRGTPTVNGNAAILACLQDTEIKVQGQTQTLTDSATFYLKRLGSDWIIDRIEYKKIR
jgi:hypothetical protein